MRFPGTEIRTQSVPQLNLELQKAEAKSTPTETIALRSVATMQTHSHTQEHLRA